ncbi:MAG: hypothetical protein ABSA39_01410 [Edaphobacter sp.]
MLDIADPLTTGRLANTADPSDIITVPSGTTAPVGERIVIVSGTPTASITTPTVG